MDSFLCARTQNHTVRDKGNNVYLTIGEDLLVFAARQSKSGGWIKGKKNAQNAEQRGERDERKSPFATDLKLGNGYVEIDWRVICRGIDNG